MEINGKVFVVTGASSGIGLATARALTVAGGKVALLARSADILQSLEAELPGSFAIPVDVTDFDALRVAIAQVANHYGRIDGLINNAGRSYGATIEQIDPKIFDEIFHLNVLAPIVAIQAVIPVMRAQGGGAIVNINSGTAFMTIPGYSVYSSSKRALVGFGLTAREELTKDGIVVSQVYPFITATNFGKNRVVAAANEGPAADYSQGDSAEFVADIIVQSIREGEAEYFANERLRQMAGR